MTDKTSKERAPAGQDELPTDAKREEFRKYLERTGVMDTLTKILVNLYEEPEKPVDALEYLRNKLTASTGAQDQLESLREQLESCTTRNQQLEMEIAQLKGVAYSPSTSKTN